MIKKLLARLTVTTKNVEVIGHATISQVVKNVTATESLKGKSDELHKELNTIRSDTVKLDHNLPSVVNGSNTTYDQKVKDAIGNFLN